jgi:uncharacterized RDD family membrane protein YckC
VRGFIPLRLFCLEFSRLFCYDVRVSGMLMQKADHTTRAVAGFIDLLIVIGLARLPDVIGFLCAITYILIRDGLFERQSFGKKVIGLRIASADDPATAISFRESIIRNVTLALAFLLFKVPYAGWVLGPAALFIECLMVLGDERGMRIGDLLARTVALPGQSSLVAPEQRPGTAASSQPDTPQSGS